MKLRDLFVLKRELNLYSLVHMLQARKHHHAIGQATLQQEMEGIPAEGGTQENKVSVGILSFAFFV